MGRGSNGGEGGPDKVAVEAKTEAEAKTQAEVVVKQVLAVAEQLEWIQNRVLLVVVWK